MYQNMKTRILASRLLPGVLKYWKSAKMIAGNLGGIGPHAILASREPGNIASQQFWCPRILGILDPKQFWCPGILGIVDRKS